MAKHASKSSHLQVVDLPKSVAVQVPLPVLGALASAENAFFDLCVEVGQQVFSVLMEQDRETLCGPKGRHDPTREAIRAGSTSSDVTLGGRRIPVRRLRARSVAGEELALPSFAFAANRDPLDRRTLEAIACGVSTRKYRRSLEEFCVTGRAPVDERPPVRASLLPLPLVISPRSRLFGRHAHSLHGGDPRPLELTFRCGDVDRALVAQPISSRA